MANKVRMIDRISTTQAEILAAPAGRAVQKQNRAVARYK
jgi:hypothetical protein